ncbi:DUF3793 family protein [Clostridium frigidicarnis]|uniref:DUF3793 family protein n=1 Tax=Clostridium frigidicarnis TaxID=84698 RepID=A0A1I0X3V0_9CLOT|nr:DUF3793 family protein [Clostridium frigidicarnis]SFA95028.1 Protein of unknown function [Clostridium frigidicarnis]
MKDKCVYFFNILNELEDKEYFENFMLYNLSLVTSKIKPSATVNLTKENRNLYKLWLVYGENFLNNEDLDYVLLRKSENSIVVLIYNRQVLSTYLNKIDNLMFLEKIGYNTNCSLEQALNKLQERYNIYNCPHELGVFLGYPLDDVIDFMECSNKKCIMCGYWKVYNNQERATETFKLYDEVRQYTLEKILIGLC